MSVTGPLAILSPCRAYRYALWRDTGVLGGVGTVLFVGLNPSTADETEDDPTIRRCVGFARDWGFAHVAMGNLYAFRATDPGLLEFAADAVGPETDAWLRRLACAADLVIAAWGGQARDEARVRVVLALLAETPAPIRCLGTTALGAPLHPLYLRADTAPETLPSKWGVPDRGVAV